MRVLHAGNDHKRRGAAGPKGASFAGGNRARAGWKYMPMRNVSADFGGGRARVGFDGGRRAMKPATKGVLVEPERYELRGQPIHHFSIARRDFFKVLGAGIAVFTVASEAPAGMPQESGRGRRAEEELPKDITSWLHVGEDGVVTTFTGKVEIGQNIRTSLAQSVADELRVPFESVRMVMGDTALTPFDMGTFGSRTTPTMAPQLRHVASVARDLL